MKKIIIPAVAIGLLLGACLPAAATDAPAPSVDLNATAAVFVLQTLQALPSLTSAPSSTPVVAAPTATPSITATLQNVASPTAGTVTSTGTLATAALSATVSSTPKTTQSSTPATPSAALNTTATETLHPRFYGTLPPDVAYTSLELANKSKAEAYISLQVTVADGSTTILEYPVAKLMSVQAPVGRYKYVVWVGGRKIIGSFGLAADHDLRITIYKDRVEVNSR